MNHSQVACFRQPLASVCLSANISYGLSLNKWGGGTQENYQINVFEQYLFKLAHAFKLKTKEAYRTSVESIKQMNRTGISLNQISENKRKKCLTEHYFVSRIETNSLNHLTIVILIRLCFKSNVTWKQTGLQQNFWITPLQQLSVHYSTDAFLLLRLNNLEKDDLRLFLNFWRPASRKKESSKVKLNMLSLLSAWSSREQEEQVLTQSLHHLIQLLVLFLLP